MNLTRHINPDKFWNQIYDVLVQECGAHESQRGDFVWHQTHEEVVEWRFCGILGFGGKFWRNSGRLYVNCYNEDETPERLAAIAKANERLGKIT